MLEVMRESDRDVLALRATGKLSTADYRDVLAPQVKMLLDRFCTLKVLFVMDEPFCGWSMGAAWANTVFDFKHRRDFAKIAIVGAPRWERWCVNLAAACVVSGKLRTYDRDRLLVAWQWVRA